jgi:hypothetical protein
MVTGASAFNGTSRASLIASILSSEPRPVSSVDPRCPPALDRVVSNCLAKDPDQRWQSAHDLATQLRFIAEDAAKPGAEASRGSLRGRSRERMAWLAATALLLAAAGFLLVSRPRTASVAPLPIRFQVPLPPGGAPSPQGGPALSPKGDRIAFSALVDGRFHVYVRSLDSLALDRVRDSEDGYAPFWSPDGREIVFAAGSELKRADLAAGSVQSVGRIENVLLGGTWSPGGVLLFAAGGRLWTMPAAGGEAKARGGAGALRTEPRFLPDGNHFVFSQADAAAPARRDVYVGSLHSEEVRRIVEDGSGASYARSGACLLFVRDNVLMAQPFDPVRAEVSGTASRASDQASMALLYNRQSAYSVSDSGAIAWLAGASADNLQLTWFDRSGRKLGTMGDPGDYSAPALSPDERSLAVSRRDAKTRTRDL